MMIFIDYDDADNDFAVVLYYNYYVFLITERWQGFYYSSNTDFNDAGIMLLWKRLRQWFLLTWWWLCLLV